MRPCVVWSAVWGAYCCNAANTRPWGRVLEGSEIPEGGYPAESVAIDGNAADRREGKVRGDKIFAACRSLLQETNPYTDRFLGVVLKAVVPVRVVRSEERRVGKEW